MREGVSELQSAELLVHGQDVMVQLGREQQVLQRSHVLLDGHVVLWHKGKCRGNIKDQLRQVRVCERVRAVTMRKICWSRSMQFLYQGVLMSTLPVSQRTRCSVSSMMKRCDDAPTCHRSQRGTIKKQTRFYLKDDQK